METIKGRQLIVITSFDGGKDKVLVIDPEETKKVTSYYGYNYLLDPEGDKFTELLHRKLEECGYVDCPCEIFEI